LGFTELFLIAVGLSMDAFAVSLCKGLAIKSADLKNAIVVGLYFGGFQALMPVIGYFLGVRFQERIVAFDHWIAFILLVAIGLNMILSSREKDTDTNNSLDVKNMLVLAVATSIDALAIGVTFAFLQVNIVFAALIIGITTFTLSLIGVRVGHIFGLRYKAKAEIAGGLILIAIGCKILLEHLF